MACPRRGCVGTRVHLVKQVRVAHEESQVNVDRANEPGFELKLAEFHSLRSGQHQ